MSRGSYMSADVALNLLNKFGKEIRGSIEMQQNIGQVRSIWEGVTMMTYI